MKNNPSGWHLGDSQVTLTRDYYEAVINPEFHLTTLLNKRQRLFDCIGPYHFQTKGKYMMGVVQFMRSLVMLAFLLGAAGTLVEATGCVGREAAKAYQRGGISFKWLNQQLVGGKSK